MANAPVLLTQKLPIIVGQAQNVKQGFAVCTE